MSNIPEPVCPKCGGVMEERQGEDGIWLSCPGFPKKCTQHSIGAGEAHTIGYLAGLKECLELIPDSYPDGDGDERNNDVYWDLKAKIEALEAELKGDGKMSYDIYLVDKDGKVIHGEKRLDLKGGTYVVGGTTEAYLNVTYNYASFFDFKALDGKVAKDTECALLNAKDSLQDDITDNYWDATEGNCREAVRSLLRLARMFPDGIWSVR